MSTNKYHRLSPELAKTTKLTCWARLSGWRGDEWSGVRDVWFEKIMRNNGYRKRERGYMTRKEGCIMHVCVTECHCPSYAVFLHPKAWFLEDSSTWGSTIMRAKVGTMNLSSDSILALHFLHPSMESKLLAVAPAMCRSIWSMPHRMSFLFLLWTLQHRVVDNATWMIPQTFYVAKAAWHVARVGTTGNDLGGTWQGSRP